MKIAWFTPFHPQSAIGQVSRIVCEELQKNCEVDIFAFDLGEYISSSVPVIKFNPVDINLHRLASYDYVVYNMGNFAGYHKEIWEVLQRYPGILLLHDQLMQNFFYQITMLPDFGGHPVTGESKYLEVMRTCYGEEGEAAGKALYKTYFGEEKKRIWESDAALAYPLLEPLLAKVTGVFSHASFFVNKIKEYFYGPTGFSYLPQTHVSSQTQAEIPVEFRDDSKVLVVSSGLVHPIKRIERVAEMLLSNPDLANRVRYAVIGNYGGPYGDYLSMLAEGPLKGCLFLLGYQTDAVMEAFLQKADFCINLRYPNSEICSKSLIEQMSFDNPVIVLNTGIYDEIPDDSVVKIKLENEMLELEKAFRFLLDNPEQRREIGRRAVDFVQNNCTAEVYASRFLAFLERIPATTAMNKVVNESVSINRTVLSDLSFNQRDTPWVVDTTWRELSKVFCAVSTKQPDPNVIGVWFGFPYSVGLRREGITRFIHYMLLALLEQYPVDCEIWTYSFNEEEVRKSFDALLNENRFKNRVQIVTEGNYKDVLDIHSSKCDLPYEINEKLDNLSYLAKQFSKATCFITAIVYLDNVIGTGKPLFVPVHDLGIHVHYDDFIVMDPLYKARHVDIRSRAENLARAGAIMFSESEYVRNEQILRYVSSIDAGQTDVIYFPVFLPSQLDEKLLPEKEIRQKFGLEKPYIYYPTQVRPYKNITLLVEALSILRERKYDVNLVLTGKPSDVMGVDLAIKKHQLNDQIICLSDVNEYELFSLYRYAVAAAVPTLFEGGFPLQACEAIYMGTPLVLSDIPVVRDRITFCGMSLENCGLEIFDPFNSVNCADALERVLLNRRETLASQKRFRDIFLSYTWKDAAAKYYQMFFGTERGIMPDTNANVDEKWKN